MEIYNNGKLVMKLQRFFVKKDNSFFLSLRGINICQEGNDIFVDEIYMPLITFSVQGHLILIDIAKPNSHFLTIALYGRFPFIHISSGKAEFEG